MEHQADVALHSRFHPRRTPPATPGAVRFTLKGGGTEMDFVGRFGCQPLFPEGTDFRPT